MGWNPLKSITNAVDPLNWSIGGNSLGNLSVGGHNVGGALSKGIHDVSSAGQTAASLYADYQTGGLSSALNGWQSKGSQGQLSSPYGKVAQIGAGLYGSGVFGNTPSGGVSWAESGLKSILPSWAGGTPASTTNPAGVASTSGGTGAIDAAGNPVSPTVGGAGAATGDAAAKAASGGTNWGRDVALGLGGVSMLTSKPQPLNPTLTGMAAPAENASNQLIKNFSSGTLNAADSVNIAQWHQQQLAQVDQYYANAGLADSSMAQQAKAQVGQQADQMRQQALNNYLNEGLSAAGIAQGPLSNAVNLQIQQDQQAQQAQQNFLKMLAMTS